MEALKEEAIQAFLSTGSGYGDGGGSGSGDGGGSGYGSGYGDGSGSGYGSGYGYGDGSGYGSGYGYGDGSGYVDCYGSGYGYVDGSGYGYGYVDGSGYGSGYVDGIKDINGSAVHLVDGIPTVFYRVRGSVARGAILNRDLTLSPCFVVKQDGTFAHGETLRDAMEALRDKLFEDMPEEERISAFVEAHKPGVPYPNRELFDWHHRLTGSCEAGRKAFVSNHGIDMDGSTTPEQFIALTEHDYGGDVIRKLRAFYPNAPKQRKSPTR